MWRHLNLSASFSSVLTASTPCVTPAGLLSWPEDALTPPMCMTSSRTGGRWAGTTPRYHSTSRSMDTSLRGWGRCFIQGYWHQVVILYFLLNLDISADSRFAPSQWETSLQSNAVSHWLGANLELALGYSFTFQSIFWENTLSSFKQKHSPKMLWPNEQLKPSGLQLVVFM